MVIWRNRAHILFKNWKKNKKTNMKYLIRTERHVHPVGCFLFASVTWRWGIVGSRRETFSETHFGSFKTPVQRCLDEALPFHTPTITHSWVQRLLAHMSPVDSAALLFQQWDTQAVSLWSSHQTPPPTNFQADLAEGRFPPALKVPCLVVTLEFQQVWKEWQRLV